MSKHDNISSSKGVPRTGQRGPTPRRRGRERRLSVRSIRRAEPDTRKIAAAVVALAMAQAEAEAEADQRAQDVPTAEGRS